MEVIKWVGFCKDLGQDQTLPPERKPVLVSTELSCDASDINPIALGYLRYSGGDKNLPFFVVPGIGGEVYRWADCLPSLEVKEYFRPWVYWERRMTKIEQGEG